ncbi:sugar phosphate isomerase/epimerase family protein [Pleomorphovibrio marinus]|uniref:sugar phosphate isomerase/epimerase family protein n=1 Tax=Pleomorphovibrio marinus TaxID=2164132 RepID=UPI000E0BAF94|nr:TIM barrel protein [Pleomorphovibrio marinus]
MNRRDACKHVALFSGALVSNPILSLGATLAPSKQQGPQPFYLFTKVLQWLPLEDVPKAVQEMGFSGIDLPVRENGFFDIQDISSKLPALKRESDKLKLNTPILTTNMNVNRMGEMEEFLKTISGEGIRHYRMGYLNFQTKDILADLEKYNGQLKKAAELHEKYDVTGHYQNHAGARIGGSVWEVHQMLKGINPDHIGIQFDLRHATVEGYKSFENVFHLVKDKIRSFDLKDFVWGNPQGKGDQPINVPLGEGNVKFSLLKEHPRWEDQALPKILHVEYDLGGAEHGHKEPTIPPQQIVSAISKDVEVYAKIFA